DPRTRRQRTRAARAAELPDGAMVKHAGRPCLVRAGLLRPWSFAGYGAPIEVAADVELLTPPAIVAVLAAGYRPMLHASTLDPCCSPAPSTASPSCPPPPPPCRCCSSSSRARR